MYTNFLLIVVGLAVACNNKYHQYKTWSAKFRRPFSLGCDHNHATYRTNHQSTEETECESKLQRYIEFCVDTYQRMVIEGDWGWVKEIKK